MRQCPVLYIDGDVDTVLRMFALTYDLRIVDSRWDYVRTGFPETGGVLDQPARLMDALDFVLLLKRDLLATRAREHADTPTDG